MQINLHFKLSCNALRKMLGAGSTWLVEGVKQDCPISPILFNLTLELVVRAVTVAARAGRCSPRVHGHDIPVLAYADDLVLLSNSGEGLQKLLVTASAMATKLRLTFKPSKCATLSLACRRGQRVLPSVYQVQGGGIPALTEEEHYRYLGVPIGLYRSGESLEALVAKMTEDIGKVESSLLAPWQKLDAIRTFVEPCASYVLRAGDCRKASLRRLRSVIVKTVRKVCSLPTRATTNYVFADRKVGASAFWIPTGMLTFK